MFGFNWIDLAIVILLIGSVITSLKIGVASQLFVLGGFFSALFLGGWLFHRLLPIEDRTLLTLVNTNLVLVFAIYAAFRGFDLNQRLHWSLKKYTFQKLDAWLGVAVGLPATLIVIWLLTSMIGRLPFVGFSNSTNDSRIVQLLESNLPPAPAVFAAFNNQIDPNNPPYVFSTPKTGAELIYSKPEFNLASTKASASVVQITGFGCGGTVSGSGFAVGPELIATNAHVIAGVDRPIVKYDGHSFETVPIYFDANLDLAILRVTSGVHKFKAKPLALAGYKLEPGVTVAMIGYPNDKFTKSPGVLRESHYLPGRNIYDLGVINRDVYVVQAFVAYGNSGGPIVISDGQVAGMVFAKFGYLDDYAYVLASPQISQALQRAKESSPRVSVGSCIAN